MKIFQKGDTVRLNSGGPLMTVEEINEKYSDGVKIDGYWVDCVWFINNVIQNGRFDHKMLYKDDGSSPGFTIL